MTSFYTFPKPIYFIHSKWTRLLGPVHKHGLKSGLLTESISLPSHSLHWLGIGLLLTFASDTILYRNCQFQKWVCEKKAEVWLNMISVSNSKH